MTPLRHPRRTCFLGQVLFAVAGRLSGGLPLPAPSPGQQLLPDRPAARADAPLADLTVAELIDRLTEVPEEGVGFHSTAWVDGFIAEDGTAEFHGGVPGSRPPSVSPAVRELVRRGVAALPELLDHLSDARETKVQAGGDIVDVMWYGDEYAPRYPEHRRQPRGVNRRQDPRPDQFMSNYTLRVGDLCYVVVGQVVNRRLNALRYQPTGCLVINSPVATPALAEAARGDWGGLTPEGHKESLILDALGGSEAAERQLAFYYPGAVAELRQRQTARPTTPWGLRVLLPAGAGFLLAALLALWWWRRRRKAGRGPRTALSQASPSLPPLPPRST